MFIKLCKNSATNRTQTCSHTDKIPFNRYFKCTIAEAVTFVSKQYGRSDNMFVDIFTPILKLTLKCQNRTDKIINITKATQ